MTTNILSFEAKFFDYNETNNIYDYNNSSYVEITFGEELLEDSLKEGEYLIEYV